MYEVYLEGAAERDLRRLPEEIFRRIIPHIRSLSEDPRPPGCRKLAGSESDWRIRVGDYRVVYEIDETERVVRVFRVRHRREAYR
ncbi:MAG: type II toxin-antitoxin system RelE/ParE family toxin [Anaerolineae bacterium]|nr:type II toxin-antitoxin system RelE/ParE family toxin [Anaerolineae bacterium]